MTNSELIQWLDKMACRYRSTAVESISRNRHMNDLGGECRLSQDEIDAMLVDFVNFCGVNRGLDYAMYTCDMKE